MADQPAFEYAPPYRVLVLMASTQAWYDATTAQREPLLEELEAAYRSVEEDGARLLVSFDDDYFVTGQPSSLGYSMFLVYEVDDLSVIANMVQRIRSSVLTRYFRMEARIGRQLFLVSN